MARSAAAPDPLSRCIDTAFQLKASAAGAPNRCGAPFCNCERSGQITDSIGAACFLGNHDRFLCADSRHVWQAVAVAREDLHDSNTLKGKFLVGTRLD
jgi:hypothetical protein